MTKPKHWTFFLPEAGTIATGKGAEIDSLIREANRLEAEARACRAAAARLDKEATAEAPRNWTRAEISKAKRDAREAQTRV